MAITHVGTEFTSNTAGSNNSGSQDVPVPSGTQSGDLMVMASYGSSGGITVGGTWTLLDSIVFSTDGNMRLEVRYRVASGSEPSTYNVSASNNTRGSSISVFRGQDSTTPVNTWADSDVGTANPATAPSVTTTTANCQIVTVRSSFSRFSVSEPTHTASDTELADYGQDNGTGSRTCAVYLSAPKSTGSVSGLSVSMAGGALTDGLMFSVALAPAPVNYTDNESDTETLADSIASAVGYTRSSSDVETLADTFSRTTGYTRGSADAETLADTTNLTINYTRTFSDVETLADAASTNLSQLTSRSFSDIETLSDTSSTVASYSRSVSDAETLSDTATPELQSSGSVNTSDVETLSDLATTVTNYLRSVSDVSDLSDVSSTTSSYIRSQSEDLILSDTATPDLQTGGGSGVITFVAASSVAAPSGGLSTMSVDKPTGTAAGDVMVIFHAGVQNNDDLTPPTGWTLITKYDGGSGVTCWAYYKVAGSSEPASYSWDYTRAGSPHVQNDWAISVMTFRNVDTTTPIRTSGNATGGSATSLTSPTLTGVQATDMVVIFGGGRPDSSGAPTVSAPDTGGYISPAASVATCADGFGAGVDGAYQINGSPAAVTFSVSSEVGVTSIALKAGAGSGGTDYNRSASDVEELSDTASSVVSYIRGLSDTETLSDSALTTAASIRAASDTETLSDSASTTSSITRSNSDAETLSDSVTSQLGNIQSYSDVSGLSDSISITVAFHRSVSDLDGLSDSATPDLQSPTGPQSFADILGLIDTFSSTRNFTRAFTEVLTLSDSAGQQLSNPNGPVFSDIIGLSDSARVELIMPHSSPGFGEIAIDRMYVIERETAKEGNDGKLSISGQESSPPTTISLVTFIHGQISGMEEGRLVPVVFRDKSERDGYYVVGASNSTLTDYQGEVATADWDIELTRMGSDTEIDIQSRLTGVVRSNDFSLTGQRWHAPSQLHYAYLTGSTLPSVISRVSSGGSIKVYLDIPTGVAPKWGCPIANYKGGRVKLLDTLEVSTENEIEGVDRRLSTAGWSLDNGLVKVLPTGTAGTLDIQTYSGSSWHSMLVDVQVGGANIPDWSSATLLRNDLEQIVLRLTAQPDPNAAGRTTLDLTLRRGSRFVEGYLQNSSSATLTVQPDTTQTVTDNSASGYIVKTTDDGSGNRMVCGSAHSFTKATRGGVTKSSATFLDFFWGAVVGGGSAQTGDSATDIRNQYIGAMTELTYAVRR